MAHITLAVTESVIRQVMREGPSQRQIAIQDASPELRSALAEARKDRQLVVAISGAFELSIGDTDAIWATHQEAGLQAQDFTSFYDLLARRFGRSVKFALE